LPKEEIFSVILRVGEPSFEHRMAGSLNTPQRREAYISRQHRRVVKHGVEPISRASRACHRTHATLSSRSPQRFGVIELRAS
jgi:hypothetical protein